MPLMIFSSSAELMNFQLSRFVFYDASQSKSSFMSHENGEPDWGPLFEAQESLHWSYTGRRT